MFTLFNRPRDKPLALECGGGGYYSLNDTFNNAVFNLFTLVLYIYDVLIPLCVKTKGRLFKSPPPRVVLVASRIRDSGSTAVPAALRSARKHRVDLFIH